jgi:hypothetical protein
MNDFFDRLLSFIETHEARLLSWGFYDLTVSPADIQQLFNEHADQSLRDAGTSVAAAGWPLTRVLDELEQANLLYRVSHSPLLYRTRFGEGVRLLARLRQLFRDNQWSTAPELVSDIKLFLRQRKYPRRDKSIDQCWELLAGIAQHPMLQRPALLALATQRDGQSMPFSDFQARAFERIFDATSRSEFSGTIICAGTGAGKTKAFFVPAFLSIVPQLDLEPFTKIIAVYPRNVLLADQLREALSEAEKLRPVLQAQGRRPLRFGALLGQTPWRDQFERKDGRAYLVEKWHGWRRQGNGFVVPFVRSPEESGRELVWRDSDRRAGRTVLYQSDGAQTEPAISDGVLALTREDLMQQPPDVLFLSLDMLNRELGNPAWSRTFGIGVDQTPHLLLLDEVHSYEGIHGAQISWVVRRWKHWARLRQLHVVGLSATLRDASSHLATIAGLRPDQIVEIGPSEDEQVHEGQEYNIAVKGAASAGTSLLSTSIQTAMLITRLMTSRQQMPSPITAPLRPEVMLGRTVFGFTDNLDGVNRWLSDMSNAELRRLASLRLHPQHRQPLTSPAPSQNELLRRDELGQIWDLPRRIGHDLAQSLRVGRCSSQDPGIRPTDDLTIATSSLEVGYDDPRVGAVIQHKRPISAASFLQRKGRAGRVRGMRPWTVVVLSDYGGDRWAFQHAEELFDPTLAPLAVPLLNQYVLRIQLTYFLIDWLGRRVQRGSPFDYLRQPNGDQFAQTEVIKILQNMLNLGREWTAFREEVRRLLSRPQGRSPQTVTDAEIDGLLWDAPRSILLHAIPSLLRKLQARWTVADPGLPHDQIHLEDQGRRHPLPAFLPSATFASLDTGQVALTLTRNSFGQTTSSQESLTVEMALAEACPGRVSKRFSVNSREVGFWHPISAQLVAGSMELEVKSVFPQHIDLGMVNGVRVFQPSASEVIHRPIDVMDSSYATWQWQNHLAFRGEGQLLPVFLGPRWSHAVSELRAYLHRDQAGVDVFRFGEFVHYELRRQKTDAVRGRLRLLRRQDGQEERQAAGFLKVVDGIRLRISVDHLRQATIRSPELDARFRVDYFRDQVANSPHLHDVANEFLIGWLWESALAMLAATALRQRCSLEEAQQLLRQIRPAAVDRVLQVVFSLQDLFDGGNHDDPRLAKDLRTLWDNPQIVQIIENLERVLWAPPDEAYERWIRERYVATWAQAFRAAATAAQPDIAEGDIAVDVQWNVDGSADVILTETESGGIGLIESIAHACCRNPSAIIDAFEHMLAFCPREETTSTLLQVTNEVIVERPWGALAQAFQSVRTANGFHGIERAKILLQDALKAVGFAPTRSAFISVVTQLLRPGSSDQTDRFVWIANALWRRFEQRLGVAIDSRVFAYCLVSRESVRRRLRDFLTGLSGGETPDEGQVFIMAERMLLRSCEDSCAECLHQPSRYAGIPQPSRILARQWLNMTVMDVEWLPDSMLWLTQVKATLRVTGTVRLVVPTQNLAAAMQTLPQLLAERIETQFLLLPTALQRVERSGSRTYLTLRTCEAVHA